MPKTLYYGQPINWANPLNRGLVSRYKVVPWYASGPRAIDIAGGWHGSPYAADTPSGTVDRTLGPMFGYGSLQFGSTANIRNTSVLFGQSDNLAVTVWAYIPTTSEKGAFVHVGTNNTIGFAVGIGNSDMDNDGNILILLMDAVAWVPFGIAAGTGWHHFAVTRDATTWRGYIDGVVSGTTSTTNPNAPVSGFQLGINGAAAEARYWNHRIDDACIYKRWLSGDEVKAQYQDQLRGSPKTLNWISTRAYGFATGGGGTSVTAADTPSTIDAIVRSLILFRTASDSPLTSDSVARALILPRIVADIPSTTDSVARTLTLPRTVADTPSTTDSADRVIVFTRSTGDTPSTIDSIARSIAFTRTTDDTPSTTDSVIRAFTGFRTADDAPITSEFVVATRNGASYTRTLSDAPSTTDSVASVLALLRTLSDVPITSEIVTRGFTGYRTLADAPFTTDIVYYTIPTADSAVIEDLIKFGFTTQEVVNYGFTTTEVISYG